MRCDNCDGYGGTNDCPTCAYLFCDKCVLTHKCRNARAAILVTLCLALGGCLILGAALTGCTITTKNQGEMGLRYGTEITFFSRAAQTAPEPATISTDVPGLLEWLFTPDAPLIPAKTTVTVSERGGHTPAPPTKPDPN